MLDMLTDRARRTGSWMMPQLGGITPGYIENILRGALVGAHVQEYELFKLMRDTDPEIASCCQEFIEGVQRKTMVWEAFAEEDEKPTPDATQRMQLCSAAIKRMAPNPANDESDIDGTVRDLLSAWFTSLCVLEIDWSDGNGALNIVNAGKLGDVTVPRCTIWSHPVTYAWDEFGRLGLRQDIGNTGAANYRTDSQFNSTPGNVGPFPENKFLIAISKAQTGSAMGNARLRTLAWWWCASNFCGDWLLNLAQLFGIPFRVAKYGAGTDPAGKAELRAMMQASGSAGYILTKDTVTMELLQANTGAGQSPQAFLFEFADRQKRKVILGQTMSGGSGTTGKGGGQAFGEVEADVKSDRIDAGAKFVCNILNRQLLPAILKVNYGDADSCPTVRMLEDDEGTLTDAQRDQVLANAGLKIGVNFLRKKYDLPAPAEGEETIGGAPEPQEPADAATNAAQNQNAKPDDSLAASALKASAKNSRFITDATDAFKSAVKPDLTMLRSIVSGELAAISLLEDEALVRSRLSALRFKIEKWQKSYELAPPGVEELNGLLSSAWAKGMENKP